MILMPALGRVGQLLTWFHVSVALAQQPLLACILQFGVVGHSPGLVQTHLN